MAGGNNTGAMNAGNSLQVAAQGMSGLRAQDYASIAQMGQRFLQNTVKTQAPQEITAPQYQPRNFLPGGALQNLGSNLHYALPNYRDFRTAPFNPIASGTPPSTLNPNLQNLINEQNQQDFINSLPSRDPRRWNRGN